MKKRILSLLLVLSMCFSLIPVVSLPASAAATAEVWINGKQIPINGITQSLGSDCGTVRASISTTKLMITLSDAKIGTTKSFEYNGSNRACGVYVKVTQEENIDVDFVLNGCNETYGDFLILQNYNKNALVGRFAFLSGSNNDGMLTVHGQTFIDHPNELYFGNVSIDLRADQSMEPSAFVAHSNIIVGEAANKGGDSITSPTLTVSSETNDRPLGMFAYSLTVNSGNVYVYGKNVGAFIQPDSVNDTGLTISGGYTEFYGDEAAVLIEDWDKKSYLGEPYKFYNKCGELGSNKSCCSIHIDSPYNDGNTLTYYSWNDDGAEIQNISKYIGYSRFSWYDADFHNTIAKSLTFGPLQATFVVFDAGEYGDIAGDSMIFSYRVPEDPIGLLPVPANRTFQNGSFNNMYFEGWAVKGEPGHIIDESYIVPTNNLELEAVWMEGNSQMNFTDVTPSSWFYDAAKYCYSKGLITGTSSTTFSPNTKCTRAMIVTILYRMDGSHGSFGGNPFSDVPNGMWYTDAVVWAAENNIVSGDGKGHFTPNAYATREQLAQIMMNYAAYCGRFDPESCAMLIGYPDSDSVSNWAGTAMSWATGNGFVNGKPKNGQNYLDPKGNATRAEFATILLRYIRTFELSRDYYIDGMLTVTVPIMWTGNVVCRYDKELGDLSFYAKKAYDAQDGFGGRLFWLELLDPHENHTLDQNFKTLCGFLWLFDNICSHVGVFTPSDLQCPFYSTEPEGAQYASMLNGYNEFDFDSSYYEFGVGVG